MSRTCALCGVRDAAGTTDIDGQLRLCCAACLAPPPPRPRQREGTAQPKPIAPGTEFRELTVRALAADPRPGAWFDCVCSCGKAKRARGADLRAGNVNSCGHLPRGPLRKRPPVRWPPRHAMAGVREAMARRRAA